MLQTIADDLSYTLKDCSSVASQLLMMKCFHILFSNIPTAGKDFVNWRKSKNKKIKHNQTE